MPKIGPIIFILNSCTVDNSNWNRPAVIRTTQYGLWSIAEKTFLFQHIGGPLAATTAETSSLCKIHICVIVTIPKKTRSQHMFATLTSQPKYTRSKGKKQGIVSVLLRFHKERCVQIIISHKKSPRAVCYRPAGSVAFSIIRSFPVKRF